MGTHRCRGVMLVQSKKKTVSKEAASQCRHAKTRKVEYDVSSGKMHTTKAVTTQLAGQPRPPQHTPNDNSTLTCWMTGVNSKLWWKDTVQAIEQLLLSQQKTAKARKNGIIAWEGRAPDIYGYLPDIFACEKIPMVSPPPHLVSHRDAPCVVQVGCVVRDSITSDIESAGAWANYCMVP